MTRPRCWKQYLWRKSVNFRFDNLKVYHDKYPGNFQHIESLFILLTQLESVTTPLSYRPNDIVGQLTPKAGISMIAVSYTPYCRGSNGNQVLSTSTGSLGIIGHLPDILPTGNPQGHETYPWHQQCILFVTIANEPTSSACLPILSLLSVLLSEALSAVG